MTTFFTLLGFFFVYEIVHAQVLKNLLEVESDTSNLILRQMWQEQDSSEDSTVNECQRES